MEALSLGWETHLQFLVIDAQVARGAAAIAEAVAAIVDFQVVNVPDRLTIGEREMNSAEDGGEASGVEPTGAGIGQLPCGEAFRDGADDTTRAEVDRAANGRVTAVRTARSVDGARARRDSLDWGSDRHGSDWLGHGVLLL